MVFPILGGFPRVFLWFSPLSHGFPRVFPWVAILPHLPPRFSNDSEWSRRSRRANMLGSSGGAVSSCGIMNDCMVNHRNSWFMLIYLLKMMIFHFANCKRLPEATVWDIVGYHIYIYWEWELSWDLRDLFEFHEFNGDPIWSNDSNGVTSLERWYVCMY